MFLLWWLISGLPAAVIKSLMSLMARAQVTLSVSYPRHWDKINTRRCCELDIRESYPGWCSGSPFWQPDTNLNGSLAWLYFYDFKNILDRKYKQHSWRVFWEEDETFPLPGHKKCVLGEFWKRESRPKGDTYYSNQNRKLWKTDDPNNRLKWT